MGLTAAQSFTAMLCDLDLLLSLWVEAACTTVYIQIKSLHAILGEKTPKEVFTSKKPIVDCMKIFGILMI